MDSIQQIAVRMVEEICSTVQKRGLNEIGETISALQPVVSKTVLEIVTVCLSEMDTALVKGAKGQRKQDGITVKERDVERTILTELGELKYKRTYFRLPEGKYVYLLDHMVGIEGYERISKELVAELLEASAEQSYAKAIQKKKQPVSRQTVHDRLVAMEEVAAEVQRMDRTPETLDLFADEDHVHLRPKGSAVVPLLTITEGMDTKDPKRHKTIHPFHLGAYGVQPAALYENMLAVLTERYDLDRVQQINVHSDGGSWIRGLQKLLPNSRMVMDGYHLGKRIRSFLRLEGAQPYAGVLRRSMRQMDGYASFAGYCESVFAKQTTESGKQRVREFVGYCAEHWASIVTRLQKETCGSCTEPLVGHVLSERLSRNPIAWSPDGLRKMTMLVLYRKNGGHVCRTNIRVRRDPGAKENFHEDGYARYRDYAIRQADAVLSVKHDWSLFEQECPVSGKVNGIYLVRKSLGSMKPLMEMVS